MYDVFINYHNKKKNPYDPTCGIVPVDGHTERQLKEFRNFIELLNLHARYKKKLDPCVVFQINYPRIRYL